MPSKLEASLCKSVKKAFRSYETMTDWWLLHAPEHYLQNAIFVYMGKEDELYLEATYKKIVEGEGKARRGRPPKHKGRRYDLIVWHRTSRTMKAVIEVKCVWSISPGLQRDAERIKEEKRAKHGYLIVYSEDTAEHGKEGLAAKFKRWSAKMGVDWINKDDFSLGKDPEWVAGFALFKRIQ